MAISLGQRVPRIGIVAGTAEGAALCYRTLFLEGGEGHRAIHAPRNHYALAPASFLS
jgi:hypothetical protein